MMHKNAYNSAAGKTGARPMITALHREMSAENTHEVQVRYAELISALSPKELEQFSTYNYARSLSGMDKKDPYNLGSTPDEEKYFLAWKKLNLLELFLHTPAVQEQMSRHEAFEHEINATVIVLKSWVDEDPKNATQEQKDFLAREGKHRGKQSIFRALNMKF